MQAVRWVARPQKRGSPSSLTIKAPDRALDRFARSSLMSSDSEDQRYCTRQAGARPVELYDFAMTPTASSTFPSPAEESAEPAGRIVRMAVISDCHARSGKTPTTDQRTWVQTEEQDPGSNPLAGLCDLIESEALHADVLLCPGDLCDQAEWSALDYVWKQLGHVARSLGASAIVATAGNHDIDSHAIHKTETIERGLLDLDPPFPSRDLAAAASYWDGRISIVNGDTWRVVTLNSTLMRELDRSAGERDHGEISRETINRLRTELRGQSAAINVLLCHHHPLPSTHLNPDDRSQMEGGDELVRLLDEIGGPWFVVHGHKHEPDLDYLVGTANSPVRLASGSVGVILSARHASHVRNQLHVIEFPIEHCEKIHLGMAGNVRSFTWRALSGWEQALAGDGLPANAGFGHRANGRALAGEIIERAQAARVGALDRAAILTSEPKLEFMLPKDIKHLIVSLTEKGCDVKLDRHGRLDRIVFYDA